jgi:hypothetical protein
MNKPVIKNLILIGIPTLISGLGIIMTLDFFSNFKNFFIYLTFGLLIAFIVFVIYYGKLEKDEQNKYTKLEDKNKELQEEIENLKTTLDSIRNILNTNICSITSFISIIEPWTLNISKIANDIKLYGKANKKDWDYEKICSDICVGCKNTIKQFVKDSNDTDISVGFIKYYIEKSQEYVKMIAHSSPQTAKPDIFDVQELLTECHYQYAKLIQKKTRNTLALENNEKIVQYFYKKNSGTDLSKYTQYIAVPILCSKNRILGVLQVTTKYDFKIMDTETDLKKFSEVYITPFVELLILSEKIQKGLFMKPNTNKNSNGKISDK